jgi:hypothetical protein
MVSDADRQVARPATPEGLADGAADVGLAAPGC